MINSKLFINELEKLIRKEKQKIENENCFASTYWLVEHNARREAFKEVIDIIKEKNFEE